MIQTPYGQFTIGSDGVIDLTTPEKDTSRKQDSTMHMLDLPYFSRDDLTKNGIESTKEKDTMQEDSPLRDAASDARIGCSKSVHNPSVKNFESTASGANSKFLNREQNKKSKPTTPLYTYKDFFPQPKVMYIRSETVADDLVQALNGAVGFDMEWCCSGKRGRGSTRPTALVQICDSTMILLIQLSAMKKVPEKVKELIESPAIPKMGVNIRGDGVKLYRDYGVVAANLVELGTLACQADQRFLDAFKRPMVSLAKCVAFYQHRTLDKGPVRTSNWEAELSCQQIEWARIDAANDAHCALIMYKKILSIARASKRPLTPSEYTTNLAEELARPQSAPPTTALKRLTLDASPTSLIAPPIDRASSSRSSNSRGSSASVTKSRAAASRATPRPQHIKAYNLWRAGNPLHSICAGLRTADNPLKESTAISYVVRALEADAALPFSMQALKELVHMEAGSWARHRQAIQGWEREGRGI